MFDQIRTGGWLTRERLSAYPIILLLLFAAAALGLALTSRAGMDAFGRPLGTDFSGIFTAGWETARGLPARAYDIAAFRADQARLFGPSKDFYVWLYPPYFLLLAGLLARLPYCAALALWQATTLAAYLVVVFAALRPAKLALTPAILAALAFPAVSINLAHGQNGFLTAALLGGGLILLKERPALAGICFGLLAYKPQFGLLLLPALLAGGHWRAIAAAGMAFALMTFGSLAALGLAPWAEFFAHLNSTRALVAEGAAGFAKNLSPFAAVRLLGGGADLAYAVQGVVCAALLLAILIVWRSRADARLKAAALLAASLVATPQVFDYDCVVLGPALAFALSYGLEEGFGSFEKTGLALVWAAPLLARPLASAACLPVGLLANLLFLMGIVRRAWQASRHAEAAPPAAAQAPRGARREVRTGIARLSRIP